MKSTESPAAGFIEACRAQFHAFESSLNGETKLPFHATRKQALERFAALGVPSTRHEEWKYTNISPIFKNEFIFPPEPVTATERMLAAHPLSGVAKNVLVFVNGRFVPELSALAHLAEGVTAGTLAQALATENRIVTEHLSRHADSETNPFIALNTAFAQDGVLLHIPAGVSQEEPVHVMHLSLAGSRAHLAAPRLLVIAEADSRAHLIESYYAPEPGTYFNTGVTEIVVQERAYFEHVKVQLESPAAYHIAATQIVQQQGSEYSSVNVDLGSAIVRNDLSVLLDGMDCLAHLYGFFRGDDSQLIDNHTLIDHANPLCESNELYKGILGRRARGVFNGKVMVRPDAQKTNAFQENKCLLLSDDAVMNAKPQLEIFADDVKCSHGATVGELDEEALFYLRARGIGEERANSILRHAFAVDVFNHIEIESLKNRVEHLIFEHFDDAD